VRRKKQKTGKIIFTILLLAAVATVAAVIYVYCFKDKEVPKEPEPATVIVDGKGGSDPEPTPEKDPEQDGNTTGKEPIQKYEGKDPNTYNTLTGAITYAGATSSNIIIRVNIDQYLGEGTCSLYLEKDGSTAYSTTANLIADVSTSTCEGFNISRAGFASGNYSIIINLASGDKTGRIEGMVSL
jgi:hypothetical protein